jgi:hypothetical protein
MRSSDGLVLLLALSTLAGCPSTVEDVTPFDCTLGIWHDDGTWEDADGADAELIFGFQGFLWISTQLATDDEAPDVANVRFSADLDGEDPFGGSQPNVALTASNGDRTSDEVQIFLSNDVGPAPFVGVVLDLAVRAISGGRECTTTAAITLKDEDDCIHTDDEEPVCDDDDDSAQ